MKPYGVAIIESPDVLDIQKMGSKGSAGKFPGRSGSYHAICRNNKAQIRRYWKRVARRAGKAECRED